MHGYQSKTSPDIKIRVPEDLNSCVNLDFFEFLYFQAVQMVTGLTKRRCGVTEGYWVLATRDKGIVELCYS